MKILTELTNELANGRPRLVHVDGHSSHIPLELLETAVANNVIIFGYPPHMTHLLQGLDVVNFNVLKASFYEQVKEFQALTGKDVKKDNFIDLLIEPINKAFTISNIDAAWRKTGLRPINPDIIPPEVLKGNSRLGRPNSFPTSPPSPVANLCRVLEQQVSKAAMIPPPPTLSVSSLAGNPFASKEDLPDALTLLNSNFGSLSIDDEHNPFISNSLYVPQKEGAAALSLLNKLQGTRADFLMCPNTITSQDHLPNLPPYTIPRQMGARVTHMADIPPQEQWNTFKNEFKALLDRTGQLQAQVVLQTMHLQGMQHKLAEKERPKELTEYRKVTGLEKNTVLTDAGVINAIKLDQEKRKKKVDDKNARQKQTELNKEGAAWRKEATQRRKDARAAQLAEWEEECEEAGLLRLRKPPKPKAVPRESTPIKYKKPQKGQQVVADAEEIDEEEEEGSISGSDDASYIGR